MNISGTEPKRSFFQVDISSSADFSRPGSAVSERSTGKIPASNQVVAKEETRAVGKRESGTSELGTNRAGQPDSEKFDPQTLAVISELKRTDREVRAHEAAHVTAGGKYVTSGPNFEYKTGPDGKQYAVGGEVQIDTSEVPGDPEATVVKMQSVKRAALAPANPSSQDRAVAASATRKAAEAELEAQKEAQDEKKADDNKQVGQLFDRAA